MSSKQRDAISRISEREYNSLGSIPYLLLGGLMLSMSAGAVILEENNRSQRAAERAQRWKLLKPYDWNNNGVFEEEEAQALANDILSYTSYTSRERKPSQ